MSDTYAARLRAARLAAGLSIRQAARLSGIPLTTYAGMERDDRGAESAERWLRAADALGFALPVSDAEPAT